MRDTLRPWALPVLLLVAAEGFARGPAAGSDALAPPSLALVALAAAAADGSLWQASAFTVGAALLGLLAGGVPALLLGLLLGVSPRVARSSFAAIELLRPMPSVALIPLALLISGFGLAMEVGVVAFATFWPMLVLAQAAAGQVPTAWLDLARALQLTPSQRVLKILLPAMLPRLFVALRLGLAVALVVSVTVEIAANPFGLGHALAQAQQSLAPAEMLGWLFWVACLGFAANVGALALQRRIDARLGGSMP